MSRTSDPLTPCESVIMDVIKYAERPMQFVQIRCRTIYSDTDLRSALKSLCDKKLLRREMPIPGRKRGYEWVLTDL